MKSGVITAIKKLMDAYKRTQDDDLLEIIYVLLDTLDDPQEPYIVPTSSPDGPYRRLYPNPYFLDPSVTAYSGPDILTTTTATTDTGVDISIDASTGEVSYSEPFSAATVDSTSFQPYTSGEDIKNEADENGPD